ncbi:MAG: haloalkane dehalogenase [Alteromonadaceae bacterium]|uniref:Haloalkane dehalogenase n=1 Tax=Paraglaciecola chathamensis TaxID=368405 RepID=A0A8H9I9N1_9ALTE|nr:MULTISPECIES: haloalkane dehalogenase [Paraglaciecola]AEE22971.1 alpha/beta hydrolase fold protein [Glaciecola sp. 4H-3-7+YE-5]MBN24373.1 haloalkane dehalogenase [Alteromonadaceae bacterium]GGZ63338.1 haloalkane dehalogenase [Paraglaciecola oceanifecundans]|tara:strand:+ start:105535 stop:106455 length:921 start_codon:yes stop_codon:yes gene_type:complete
MQYLRTPDACFEGLTAYPFKPNYLFVDDFDGGEMRMHYLDEGSKDGEVVLLLHGEPSWSFLYRNMIAPITDKGYRVIVPDLIGFGRSDKPTKRSDYTYQRHLDWLRNILSQLSLENITLVCQDWGGLLGLRLVAEHPDKFARVLAANTMLPTGDHAPGEAFMKWRTFSQEVAEFPVAGIIKGATVTELAPSVLEGYNAPYPSEEHKAGVRQFPLLVPITTDDPQTENNRAAWQTLKRFSKPFLTAFSDSDPITAGGDKIMQKLIPGTQGQSHTTITNGGHFLQEDQPQQLAQVLLQFINDNPISTD